ncbi:hypothetical protein BJX64DRAFT_291446 [Aspergillus heterothallicus]
MNPLKRKLQSSQATIRYLAKRLKCHLPGSHHGMSHAGRFKTIPPELINIIATYLDVADICALRCTCVYIKNATLHHWESNYSLQTIRTDFSKKSLKRFQRLCKSRERILKVERLRVWPTLGEPYDSKHFGRGFSWKHEYSNGVYWLVENQDGAHEWRKVFAKLVNCRSFIIGGQQLERSYIQQRNLVTVAEALMLLLYIIGGVELPVKSIEICPDPLRPWPTSLAWTDFFTSPAFQSAWSSLSELSLHNILAQENRPDFFNHLIAAATQLRRLEIRDASLNILGAVTANLRSLYMGHGIIFAWRIEPLCEALKSRAGHLRSLTLKALETERTGWKPLLASLRKHNSSLDEIEIGDLSSKGGGTYRLHWPQLPQHAVVDPASEAQITYTTAPSQHGPDLVVALRYSGPKMHHALRVIEVLAEEG